MKKLLLGLMLGMILLSLVSANEVHEQNVLTDLRFTCTLNNAIPSSAATYNATISYPNGTALINNAGTSALGQGAFNLTVTFPEVATYKVESFCYDGVYSFSSEEYIDVTSTGREDLDSMPSLLIGIIFIVFGVACFFLFLASQTIEVGPKLFFFLSSMVFLIGSIAIGYVVLNESNAIASVSVTMEVILYSLGIILIVIFFYVFIKQTVSILELMRIKKGYSMGNVQRFGYSYSGKPGGFM